MRLANSPGKASRVLLANFSPTSHETAKPNFVAPQKGPPYRAASAREFADDVLFRHAVAFRFSFLFRSRTRPCSGDGAGSALAGVSFHWHIRTRAAFRGGTGQPLPRSPVTFAHGSRRTVSSQDRFQLYPDVLRRDRCVSVVLDSLQSSVLGCYSLSVSRHFVGNRRFLRVGHLVIGGHSESQSPRTLAAVGIVPTYDPRDLGHNPLYGDHHSCRGTWRCPTLVASSDRI